MYHCPKLIRQALILERQDVVPHFEHLEPVNCRENVATVIWSNLDHFGTHFASTRSTNLYLNTSEGKVNEVLYWIYTKYLHFHEVSRFWQFTLFFSCKINHINGNCGIGISWFGISNLPYGGVCVTWRSIPGELIPVNLSVIELNICQVFALGREPKGVVRVQHLLCWQRQ